MAGEAEDRGSLADAWHARDDEMRHVAILGYYLEALDGLGVTDYIVQVDWSVFFDPGGLLVGYMHHFAQADTHQGKS